MQVIEEGELAVGLGMIQGPGGFLVGGGELAGDEILFNGGAVQHFAKREVFGTNHDKTGCG